jgi:hypothetical protein
MHAVEVSKRPKTAFFTGRSEFEHWLGVSASPFFSY